MGKILVTGAAGFIGSHLVDALLKTETDTIIGLDNFDDFYPRSLKEHNLLQANLHPNFKLVEGDFCDPVVLHRLTETFPDIQTIFHIGARAGVRPSIQNPQLVLENEVVEDQASRLSLPGKKSPVFAYGSCRTIPARVPPYLQWKHILHQTQQEQIRIADHQSYT